MLVQEDLYPSRVREGAPFRERQDPIVHPAGPVSNRLTRDELDQYESSGYLFVESLLRAEEVSRFSDEFRRLAQAPYLRNSQEVIT